MELAQLSNLMLALPNEQFDILTELYRSCRELPEAERNSFIKDNRIGFDKGLLEELVSADGRFRNKILRELRSMGLKEEVSPSGPFFTYIRLLRMKEDPSYVNFLYEQSLLEMQDHEFPHNY